MPFACIPSLKIVHFVLFLFLKLYTKPVEISTDNLQSASENVYNQSFCTDTTSTRD